MWRYLFLLGLYLTSTAAPLLLGVGRNLEYEYALLASWSALVLIPLYGLFLPARYLPLQGSATAVDEAQQIFWIFLFGPATAFLPPVAMFLLKACPCSRTGFVFWMAYLWYPAWILSHALLHGILRLRCLGFRKRMVSAGLLLLFVGAGFLTLITLWHEPQKRYLGLFSGFLHGPIYDELILMDHGLILGRLAHVLIATALLTLAWWQKRSYGVMIATASLAALAWTCSSLSASYPSMGRTKEALDQQLSGTVEGPGFTLHFVPGEVSGGKNEPGPRILRLYRDLEFHTQELAATLQDGTKKLPHVEIYAYDNDVQKKLWFGGGDTDVTDVHTPSVHITLDTWPHPTLRHELVHALASGFGFHGLGFHPNIAFTEGLAVALAPEPRKMTIDDGAASLIESGRLPAIESLFSPQFWRVSGSRAYTVAGSFIRFLIETRGIQGVKALYAGEKWQKAFGTSQESLVKAWRDKIIAAYDTGRDTLYAEALFRAPGLFEDLCPHSKSDLAQTRDASFYVRLRQPLGWDPTAEYAPWLATLEPTNIDASVKLWRKEIRRLGTERFPDPGKLHEWRNVLAKALHQPPKSLEDVEIALLLSDLLRLQGEIDESLKPLAMIQKTAAQRYLGDQLIRETEVRLRVEQLGDPLALEWRKLLAGFTKTLPDQTKEPPDVWILSYLRFRHAKDDQISRDELARLLSQVPPDIALPQTFAFEWYRLLADRLMKVEDYTLASQAFALAAAVARPATKDLYEEHARRALFYAAKGVLSKAAPKARL